MGDGMRGAGEQGRGSWGRASGLFLFAPSPPFSPGAFGGTDRLKAPSQHGENMSEPDDSSGTNDIRTTTQIHTDAPRTKRRQTQQAERPGGRRASRLMLYAYPASRAPPEPLSPSRPELCTDTQNAFFVFYFLLVWPFHPGAARRWTSVGFLPASSDGTSVFPSVHRDGSSDQASSE